MKFGLKENVIEQIHQVFSTAEQVEEAILYGSRAKGNFKNGSDIDIVLKGRGLTLQVMNQIGTRLDDLLLPYMFDVSVHSRISDPDLLDHIRRIGVIFYQKKKEDQKKVSAR